MAQVINTNSLSLMTQNNLNTSQSALNTAIQRLSSGLRINSAKDDAAGQAIANRFTANIRGLTQAQRNANDGISLAQTTEGALTEVNNNLQRIRELTVQAANGTNSDSDLESIQAEITQRLSEITRVADQTQFNGVKVLAANQTLTIQVGANDSETISIDLKQINAGTLGLDRLDVTKQVVSSDLRTVTFGSGTTAATTAVTFTGVGGADYELVIGTDGNLYATDGANYYDATYDASTNSVSVAGAANTSITAADIATNATEFVVGGTIVELSEAKAASLIPAAVSTAGASLMMYNTLDGTFYQVKAGNTYYSAVVDQTTGIATFDIGSATSVSYNNLTGIAVTSVQVRATEASAADLSGVNTALGGANSLMQDQKTGAYYIKNVLDGVTTYYSAALGTVNANGTVNVITSSDYRVVVDPLAAIDKALAQVDSLRSGLGAMQNRFESTITNLNNTTNNLSASRSRIEDADYATEVSNMTKAQILQQAGTSVLAQANQVPQTILSLLR